jgi:hypothetical protein
MAGAKAPEVFFGAARLDNHGVNKKGKRDAFYILGFSGTSRLNIKI